MVRGHTTAGYHDGKLVYPGLVVEKAGPRTFDLFTTDVALKALKIRQTALYSEAAVEINDEKIIENWAAVLNVLAMLMASLYNIADTTLVFVGSRESAASSALEYFKKRLRVGSDEILPGYPFVPELPTERGMMALDLLDAHIFNLRTPFHGTIFTSPAYRFSEEFINPIRLLCSFGVRSIRKGVFEKSRDCTCGCGYFLNMFLTFIENKRGDPVAVIKKAMERMICGSFIKSGNEEKRRSLAYRFLSLIFLLMSHGRDDLIEASETTMTLKVGRILDAIRDRRKRIGMNKIDPHEIIDSLKLHGGFIEGRPSEIKIEKGFWDEAYSGWIDCCLKFIA
jgi:hypothetical protein